MTLLLSTLAAIITAIVWYTNENRSVLKLGTLCLMYGGASIMWFVDAIFEYAEAGAEYFIPSAADMLNDTFLGISVVALGLVIWIVILFVKDPQGIVRKTLLEQK